METLNKSIKSNPFNQLREVAAFFDYKVDDYNHISSVVTQTYSKYIEANYPGNIGWRPHEGWLHNFVTWIMQEKAARITVDKILFEIRREAERDIHSIA